MAGCGGAKFEGADDRDAPRFEIEMRDDESRAGQRDQRAGKARADFFKQDDAGETGCADRQREEVGFADVVANQRQAVKHLALAAGQAEQRRRLRDRDMDGDAREKPRHDRNGQQIGHPARPKHAGQHQNQADQQSERRGEFAIIRQANGSQQRQRAREDRHDRGIRARREKAVRAERREGGRSRDKGEKAEFGREAAKPSGRHLGGDDDGREREAGDEIEAKGGKPDALKGAEQRPLFFFVVVHRSRFALIDLRLTLPLRGRVARPARGGMGQRPKTRGVTPPRTASRFDPCPQGEGEKSASSHYLRASLEFALDVIRSWRARRS